MSDRRRWARFQVEKQTHCYLDGCRFDSPTWDMSPGGAFLATDDVIPLGADIVLLFEAAAGAELPVHLVGRVVRRQEEPVRGIGVAWLRAVSGGDMGQMAAFLYEVLRLASLETTPRIRTDADRCWYDFDPLPERAAEPGLPDNVVRISDAARFGRYGAQLYVVRTDDHPAWDQSTVGGIEEPSYHRRPHKGPITTFIHGDQASFEVSLPVTMTVGRTTCRVMMTAIGRCSITVRADVAPAAPDTPILVDLRIPTREGEATVLLTCEVGERIPPRGGRPGLLELRIARVVDESYAGLFERYLKWLRCRDVSGKRASGSRP